MILKNDEGKDEMKETNLDEGGRERGNGGEKS